MKKIILNENIAEVFDLDEFIKANLDGLDEFELIALKNLGIGQTTLISVHFGYDSVKRIS